MKKNLVIVLYFCGMVYSKTGEIQESEVQIESYVFEDAILEFIEGIKADLPDPLEIAVEASLNPNSFFINGSLNIQNITLSALRELEVPSVSLSLIGVIFNLTLLFPRLEVDVNYNTNFFLVSVSPFDGEGVASLGINSLTVSVDTAINLTSPIHLQDLKLEIGLGSVDVNITGFLHNEDVSSFISSLISPLANSLIVSSIKENAEYISYLFSKPLQDVINSLLGSSESYEKRLKNLLNI